MKSSRHLSDDLFGCVDEHDEQEVLWRARLHSREVRTQDMEGIT